MSTKYRSPATVATERILELEKQWSTLSKSETAKDAAPPDANSAAGVGAGPKKAHNNEAQTDSRSNVHEPAPHSKDYTSSRN